MAKWVDLHCHVLPGVDDGPADIPTAVTLVQGLQNLGFTEIHPTPHQREHFWIPTPEDVDAAVKSLRKSLEEVHSEVTICTPAAENMWDVLFLERFEKGLCTPYEGGKALLIELPPTTDLPPQFSERVFAFRMKGQLPVLAHVEFYKELMGDPIQAEKLASQAALLVNLSSIGGIRGRQARQMSRNLVRHGLVHGAATDVHNQNDVSFCQMGIEWIQSNMGDDVVQFLLCDGPKSILVGEIPEW
ncbi:MAG: CpsB/CapC family capsule biosynthesis tyrosine phosphatase [Pseudomonadota bacterium]